MKTLQLLALVVVVVLVTAAPAFGQTTSNSYTFSGVAAGAGLAGLGAGLVLVGAGMGFGRIGASALESMARQPEVAGSISGSMIVIAALLEGATFFALIVCLLVSLNVGGGGF